MGNHAGAWARIVDLVAAECPYGSLHGVHIMEGRIVSCEGIQQSLPCFARPASVFDDQWEALASFCAKLGCGRVAELRFRRGSPISARLHGRRGRRLVGKP